MAITKISLVFTDLDQENANMEIVLEPPIEDLMNTFSTLEASKQPSAELTKLILSFLSQIKQSQEEEPSTSGGSGSNLIQTLN